MLRRTNLIHSLLLGLTSLVNWPAFRAGQQATSQQASMPHRGHGKGKVRMGASRAFHAPTYTQRDYGKAARRRRRAARLRRG